MSLRRVLMVDSDAGTLQVDQDVMVRMGVIFDSCVGPTVAGGCPVLRGEDCAKLTAADGVIFHLGGDEPVNRRLMLTYIQHATSMDVPLCVIDSAQPPADGEVQTGSVAWFPAMLVDDMDAFATRIKSRSSHRRER